MGKQTGMEVLRLAIASTPKWWGEKEASILSKTDGNAVSMVSESVKHATRLKARQSGPSALPLKDAQEHQIQRPPHPFCRQHNHHGQYF